MSKLPLKDARARDLFPLTSRNILINCETTDTVVCLKSRIRDKEGIAPDVQSLIFAGKELENHLSLRTYGIKNLSQVHLVRLMRGGGGPPRMFADVSDDSILVVREFSPDAPEWRIVRRGLNIEGRCKNVECAAYQHMVIHPKQYEAFNLMRDDDIRCPICYTKELVGFIADDAVTPELFDYLGW
ncbi:Ubiquitin family [Phytophthora infestans]|uniref:Ubiquitin family n=1 Tax=Phytophthora infestans TaxID=4787 RepID=A0A833SJ08_PHYIN|nr:Ubiquitin family [Phytophthora infestans]KAF4130501.1 Ubiquitin family [Phytophthora infestans]